MTIQIKAIERYFTVMLFTIYVLYKVVLTLKSVDAIRKCDHSNESFEHYVPVVLFIMPYKSVDEIISCDHSNECLSNASEQYILLRCLFRCTRCI